jgi:hypothetical protein
MVNLQVSSIMAPSANSMISIKHRLSPCPGVVVYPLVLPAVPFCMILKLIMCIPAFRRAEMQISHVLFYFRSVLLELLAANVTGYNGHGLFSGRATASSARSGAVFALPALYLRFMHLKRLLAPDISLQYNFQGGNALPDNTTGTRWSVCFSARRIQGRFLTFFRSSWNIYCISSYVRLSRKTISSDSIFLFI